ncbi:hypothetical protein Scep_027938 [Stephania cephalantha]|uniref:Uncharacterized protein n=1 Tax=Stephania cephalantha TaxID=152367 RepID=A0AAP0E902_9MAGN
MSSPIFLNELMEFDSRYDVTLIQATGVISHGDHTGNGFSNQHVGGILEARRGKERHDMEEKKSKETNFRGPTLWCTRDGAIIRTELPLKSICYDLFRGDKMKEKEKTEKRKKRDQKARERGRKEREEERRRPAAPSATSGGTAASGDRTAVAASSRISAEEVATIAPGNGCDRA